MSKGASCLLLDSGFACLQVCRKCNTNKSITEFPQKKSHPDGRDDYCKACHAKATAARVAARGPVKEPTVESKVSHHCNEVLTLAQLISGRIKEGIMIDGSHAGVQSAAY